MWHRLFSKVPLQHTPKAASHRDLTICSARALPTQLLHVDCSTSSLLLTSPLFAPHELRVSPQHTHHPSSLNHPAGSHTAPCSAPLQRSLGELIFETFAFKQCVRKAAAELVLLDHTTRNPDSLAAKTGCAMVRQSKGSYASRAALLHGGHSNRLWTPASPSRMPTRLSIEASLPLP